MTVFPAPDFSLCLSLLPPHSLIPNPAANSLSEAVQKLNTLHTLLNNAQYDEFWASLDSDDLYADLIADVQGFEELMRVRMAVVISQSMQSVDKALLEAWLNVKEDSFDHFVKEVCGWTVEGDVVTIPLNKENEARGTVVRENVKFDRESPESRRKVQQEQNANLANYRILKNDQARIRAARIDDKSCVAGFGIVESYNFTTSLC